ncbi:MAG: hypothetical protein ACLVBP_13155 [Ruminococcus sp.]
MFENNLWTMEPVGRPENTIQGDKYRFTLLTPCLIRMEYREDGKFEDRPTQVVWNRKFDPVDFRVEKKEGFELFTEQNACYLCRRTFYQKQSELKRSRRSERLWCSMVLWGKR